MRSAALTTALIPAILLLSACHRDRKEPEPEPAATETEEPVQSIIRSDVEQPDLLPPLEPLAESVSFAAGGYELSNAALTKLTEVLESRQMAKGGAITLGGHTDAAGNDRGNIAASEKRAEAVRDWLLEKGVAEARMTVIAFGEQNPAEPNANPDGTPNEAGRAANRRVQIDIAVRGEAGERADISDEPESGEGEVGAVAD